MRIRPMTVFDIEKLIALGRLMHIESVYASLDFNEEKLFIFGMSILASQNYICMVAENSDGIIVGMFVGYWSEHPFGRSKIANDFILFVEPDARGTTAAPRLIKSFENWCRDHDVSMIALGTSTGVNPERTFALYEKLGYTLTGSMAFKLL